MNKSIAIALVLILGVLVGAVLADQETLFEQQYVRTKGKPDKNVDSFSIHGSASAARLIVKNGTESGSGRISSAKIRFNGEQVFRTNDFSQQVYRLEAGVDLVGTNTISVELRGKPGGYLTIELINTLPVAAPQSMTTDEDTAATISVSGSDSESDGLTYAIAAQPSHGTATASGSDITYTPAADFNGPDFFTFTADDGASLSEPATVSITVTPVNDWPQANDDLISTNEDTDAVFGVLANDTDVDNDNLDVFEFTAPANGALVENDDNTFTYTPNLNFNGADSFTYTLSDGNGGSDTASVNISVNPVNDPPVASAGPDQEVLVSDTVTLNGGGSTDVDGDNLTYQWSFLSKPPQSLASLSFPTSGSATFLADRPGGYEVRLVVNDGSIGSSPDSVSITANPRMVSVPNVVGLVQSGAEAVLTEAGLAVGAIGESNHEAVPAGHVISQEPAAGESVVEGSLLNLIVSLGPENQNPLVSISASPAEISQGDSCTLSWNAANADSVHIDNGIGTVNPQGAVAVSPQHTTTYTITVSGELGATNASVTVEVMGGPDTPTGRGFRRAVQ